MKKMIIVSPETHSSLFFLKGKMQRKTGENITFDAVMKVLLSHYALVYKLEEKE